MTKLGASFVVPIKQMWRWQIFFFYNNNRMGTKKWNNWKRSNLIGKQKTNFIFLLKISDPRFSNKDGLFNFRLIREIFDF